MCCLEGKKSDEPVSLKSELLGEKRHILTSGFLSSYTSLLGLLLFSPFIFAMLYFALSAVPLSNLLSVTYVCRNGDFVYCVPCPFRGSRSRLQIEIGSIESCRKQDEIPRSSLERPSFYRSVKYGRDVIKIKLEEAWVSR